MITLPMLYRKGLEKDQLRVTILSSLVAEGQSQWSSDNMSNTKDEVAFADEMQPVYDFSGGVRGKHAQAYQRGHRVIIHKPDGTTEIQEFTLPEGTVVLDPDVRAYFPDAESVNRALRGLIDLIPEQRVAHHLSA